MANRDQTLFVNVTRDEKKRLEKQAKTRGGLSSWARGVLLEEVEFLTHGLPLLKRRMRAAAARGKVSTKKSRKAA